VTRVVVGDAAVAIVNTGETASEVEKEIDELILK